MATLSPRIHTLCCVIRVYTHVEYLHEECVDQYMHVGIRVFLYLILDMHNFYAYFMIVVIVRTWRWYHSSLNQTPTPAALIAIQNKVNTRYR